MDIKTCQWSPDLLEAFGVPKECLPTIKSSSEIYKNVVDSGCPEFDGIPISGDAGDQQAACIGQGLFEAGQVKCVYDI